MAVATPTTRFARRQARRLLTDLRREFALAADAPSPDAVHDLRVAIRRFRQALIVFRAAFPARQCRKIHKKLKQVMHRAGEVRNCDIAAILIPKLDARIAPQLRPHLQKDRETAEGKLTQTLRRLSDRKLPAKWRARLGLNRATATNGSARRALSPATHRRVAEMATEFLNLGEKAMDPKTSADDIHRFRIASKKFRYTLELVEPSYGAELTPWLERVKAVQSVLGDANDCETVRRMASKWGAPDDLIAKLDKRQNRKVKKFRREWDGEPGAGVIPVVAPVKPAAKANPVRRGNARSAA